MISQLSWRGTSILLIKFHKGKDRQNFYDSNIVNPKWKESESRFFTNTAKFTSLGDFTTIQ